VHLLEDGRQEGDALHLQSSGDFLSASGNKIKDKHRKIEIKCKTYQAYSPAGNIEPGTKLTGVEESLAGRVHNIQASGWLGDASGP
jgi:hypothetical protein